MDAQASSASLSKDKEITELLQVIKKLNAKIAASKQQTYDVSNPEIAKKLHDVQIASLEQRADYYRDYTKLYNWELSASSVMLWVTVIVVVCGLIFSGIQLWHAMKVGQNTDGTWEISATGMKITSSIVGVVVLAMSIAFVYLFLDRVYPIK
jgi:hypothetical protein